VNRLKIVKLLSQRGRLTVTELSNELDISLGATSKHLIMLHNLDVLEPTGKDGHVYYSLRTQIPADTQKALKVFL